MTSSLHLVNGSTFTGANLDEVLCPVIAKVRVQILVKPQLSIISSSAQVIPENARSAFVIHLLHPKFTFIEKLRLSDKLNNGFCLILFVYYTTIG